jgi:hypothetical protein
VAKKSRRPVRGVPSSTPISTPSGEPPAAASVERTRRTRSRRTRQPRFSERYRTWILGGVAALGILNVGYVLFSGASTAAYSCGMPPAQSPVLLTPGPVESLTPRPSLIATPSPAASGSPAATDSPAASGTPAPSTSPAASAPVPSASPAASAEASASPGASASAEPSPAPEPTPRLGFTTEILGTTHVPVGTVVNYAFCPPTSGNHYQQPAAPIPARVYPPSDPKAPQYWIHNLEHGYVVVGYRCPSGVLGQGDCVTQEEMNEMQQFFDQAPDSGVAACPTKVVVVRFDAMDTKFAYLAWGRALLTNDFDIDTANTFTEQWMDHDATPEKGAC